jgi:hypothetical protein
MITISKFYAATFSTGFMDLRWEVAETTEDLSIYTYYIDRSGAEEGPWSELTPQGLSDTYRFRDGRVNLQAKRRDYFYRLRVVNTETTGTSTVGPIRHSYEPDVIALDISRREAMNIRVNIGELCFVFLKKRFGARCACYDRNLNKVSKPNCLSCFGTSWVGGYYRPTLTWVNIVDASDNKNTTEIGQVEKNYGQYVMPSYPVIESEDLIIDGIGRRWRVLSPVMYRKLRGTLLKQMGNLYQIDPGDVAHSIPIQQSDYQRYQAAIRHYESITDYYPDDTAQDIDIERDTREEWGRKRFIDIDLSFPWPSLDSE